MAEILSTVSVIAFVVAGICLVVAILLWVLFRIPYVIGDLSGRNAKRSLEQMRKNNEKTGYKAYRTSQTNLERGKLTDTMTGYGESADSNETDLLNLGSHDYSYSRSEETEALTDSENPTDVLNGSDYSSTYHRDEYGTEPLYGSEDETTTLTSDMINEEPKNKKKINITDETVLVNTDEVI